MATKAIVALAGVAALGAIAGVAHAGSRYPGPLLTTYRGSAIYASFVNGAKPAVVCPRGARVVGSAELRRVGAAVAAAMPALYRRAGRPGHPTVNARDARTQVGRASSSGAGEAFAATCGHSVWTRTIYVAVTLPHVTFSASLAHPSYEVALTPAGYVIWAEVH